MGHSASSNMDNYNHKIKMCVGCGMLLPSCVSSGLLEILLCWFPCLSCVSAIMCMCRAYAHLSFSCPSVLSLCVASVCCLDLHPCSHNFLVSNDLSCPCENLRTHLQTYDIARTCPLNAPGNFPKNVPGSKAIWGHMSCDLKASGLYEAWTKI